jgi:hypothetical protein
MPVKTMPKVLLAVALFMGVLLLLRFKPWQQAGTSKAKQKLTVGFLPVT